MDNSLIDLFTVNNFVKENPIFYAAAKSLTCDFEILAKIYNNLTLFIKLWRSKCQKFVHLVEAVYEMEKHNKESKQEVFLVHFADINLYALFAHDIYLQFINNLSDALDDNKLDCIKIYQVVLSGTCQKLVVVCTDENHYVKLRQYAQECFAAATTIVGNQITIDIITQNEQEIITNYNKLYNYIYNKNEIIIAESMKQIQLLQKIHWSYHNYDISNTLQLKKIDDLISALRGGKFINNGVIIIGNNNIGIVGNNINNNVIDKNQLAIAWIRNNPPQDREKTTDYYKRYYVSNAELLADNQFAKIMRNESYSTAQTAAGWRYWKK